MTDALKPCNCCGNKKAPKLVRTPTQVFVWCDTYSMQGDDGCGARSGLYATDKEAIAAWNTRADSPRIAELEAENARLRKDAGRYLRLKNIANRWRGRMAAKVSITETCPEFGDRKEIQDLDRYLDLVEESER